MMFLLHVDLKNIVMPKMTLSWIIAVRQFIGHLCSPEEKAQFSDTHVENIGILEKDDQPWVVSAVVPASQEAEAEESLDSQEDSRPALAT